MAYYKPEELENIKRGLEWAKKNPADPKSIEIQNRLKSGQLNFELKALGLNEVPVKVPKVVMPTTPQEQGMMSEVPKDGTIKEAGKDMLQTAQSIGQTVSQGAQNIQDIAGNENLNFAQKSMGVLGSLLGTGAKTIGDVTTGVGKLALTQEAEDSLKSFVQEKAQGIADTEVVKKVADWYQNLDEDNKLIVDSAGGFIALVSELAGGGVAGKVKKPVQEGIEMAIDKTKDVGQTAMSKTDQFVATRKTAQEIAQAEAQKNAITEIIAPGVNAKEFRRAVDEGRVTRGEQGFWIGKKPDVVEVSDKVKEMADTIQRTVPNASTLDDVGMATRIKTQVETIASELEPKMREVKLRDITPSETPIAKVAKQYKTVDDFVNAFNRGELDIETVNLLKKEYGDDIFDDVTALKDVYARAQNPSMIDVAYDAWARIKKTQSNEPEFLDFPSNKAFQDRFENYLNQLRKGTNEKTLADLWNVRKSYDASIPDRIKQANDMSPIQSQIQKQMWLENRRILNDLINDTTRGLGSESQQAFKDMSNLYAARENIIGKAKPDLKGQPGALEKTKEAVTDRLVPFSIGVIVP